MSAALLAGAGCGLPHPGPDDAATPTPLFDAGPPPACVARCRAGYCGGDGCGGYCGCPARHVCTRDGVCACAPACAGRACGSDGCGGACGACPGATRCEGGACLAATACPAACPEGFRCEDATRGCELDPVRPWRLVVLGASLARTAPGGGSWDPLGGAPDPFVCVEAAAVSAAGTPQLVRACTRTLPNTYEPRWSAAAGDYAVLDAATLGTRVVLEAYDEDAVTGGEVVCRFATAFGVSAFERGGDVLVCANAAITVALEPR